MDDATLGPSPKEIMALGAMVERTMTCKCRDDEVDDTDVEIQKDYGRGLAWHNGHISWDDATLETAGLTDFHSGFVEIDKSILDEEDEDKDDDNLDDILDKFEPAKIESNKTSSKFLPGRTQKRTPKVETTSFYSFLSTPATITPVADEDDQSGFEVDFRRFEI